MKLSKVLSMILAIAMVLGMFAVPAFATDGRVELVVNVIGSDFEVGDEFTVEFSFNFADGGVLSAYQFDLNWPAGALSFVSASFGAPAFAHVGIGASTPAGLNGVRVGGSVAGIYEGGIGGMIGTMVLRVEDASQDINLNITYAHLDGFLGDWWMPMNPGTMVLPGMPGSTSNATVTVEDDEPGPGPGGDGHVFIRPAADTPANVLVGEEFSLIVSAHDLADIHNLNVGLEFDLDYVEIVRFEWMGPAAFVQLPGSGIVGGRVDLWAAVAEAGADIASIGGTTANPTAFWRVVLSPVVPTVYHATATGWDTSDLIEFAFAAGAPDAFGGRERFSVAGLVQVPTEFVDIAEITILTPTGGTPVTMNTTGNTYIDFTYEVTFVNYDDCAPIPDNHYEWIVVNYTPGDGSTATASPHFNAQGQLVLPEGFEGSVLVRVYAEYNNNFGADRLTNPDRPWDEIIITTEEVWDPYRIVEITGSTPTIPVDRDEDVTFAHVVLWDCPPGRNPEILSRPVDQEVVWSIRLPNGDPVPGNIAVIDPNTGVFSMVDADWEGDILVRATSVNDNPTQFVWGTTDLWPNQDGYRPYDEILIRITDEEITFPLNVTVVGTIRLAHKLRTVAGGAGVRADVDADIRVTLYANAAAFDARTPIATVAAVYTDNDGNFELSLPEIDVDTTFYIRMARRDGGTRDEAYRDLQVRLIVAADADGEVTLSSGNYFQPTTDVFWLFPGAFAGANATLITDYQAIRGAVGLAGVGGTAVMDINEVNGIDGADLAAVRASILGMETIEIEID
ncbi:MAG: hypothetical protein FWE04_02075 [Oscillospiraceae bacterium]|nr:hypothetical protein [Oscillospiraceae bacterium]